MTRDVTQRVRVSHVNHDHDRTDLNIQSRTKETHEMLSRTMLGSSQRYETEINASCILFHSTENFSNFQKRED